MFATGPAVITVAGDVAAIVRPAALALDGVVVCERDGSLDEAMTAAERALRISADLTDRLTAVRTMYKRVGLDPTKTRPSSEALLRRVRKGDALPRINTLVDVVNWCSAESQLPFGLYDRDQIEGEITLRLGRPGESYPGIRKDDVRVEGRLTLVDLRGPFGNPTSDSARTMVTTSTTRALVVMFAPATTTSAAIDDVLRLTTRRVGEFCVAGRAAQGLDEGAGTLRR